MPLAVWQEFYHFYVDKITKPFETKDSIRLDWERNFDGYFGLQLGVGSRVDGDKMAGPEHRCVARAGDEEVGERQWASGQRRSSQRHDGGRVVSRKRGGPGRASIAVEFTFALAGRAAGTHRSHNGTRSQGIVDPRFYVKSPGQAYRSRIRYELSASIDLLASSTFDEIFGSCATLLCINSAIAPQLFYLSQPCPDLEINIYRVVM